MAKRHKKSKWSHPDWRYPESYPKPLPDDDHSDYSLWRWEFLRRDDTYREDWSQFRQLKHPFELALDEDPSDPGYDIPMYPDEYENRHGHVYYALWKHKMGRLLNPNHANPQHLKFYPIPSDGVLVWFDLAMPLREQLQHAKHVLEKYRGCQNGLPVRGTLPDKIKWPLFLRILDAYEDGVTLAEIAASLLGLSKQDPYSRQQAISNVKSHIAIGRQFWKKIPIRREVPEIDGKLLRGEDLMDLFPPYLPRTGDDIDRVMPPQMPRVTLPL